ncbi:MAG TPA: M6 family metalloprotease domain-containing protein [Ramlibacter sp.]|jgi:M6 family metalloprotease-like protein
MSLPHVPLPSRTRRPRWQQRIDDAKRELGRQARMPGLAQAPPRQETRGACTGLALPVEFPDVPGLPRGAVDAFCNEPGFSGFGNRGSVADYFRDISNHQLEYRTVVAPYYRARHPRAHYLDPAVPYGQRASELVLEALAFHRDLGLAFDDLTVDAEGSVRATSLLYAGPVANTHGQGLWPHASSLAEGMSLGGGRSVGDYQVCAMDDRLALGVYCHETGHMLCDFPDLYEYDGERRAGCGSFCLMGFGAVADELNPPQVGAYLKFKAGWARPQVLEPGRSYVARADGNQLFIHPRSATEYFLIELRAQAGRDAALPDAGLAIWHIDELGSNAEPHKAAEGHRHYECRLLQADGRDDLGAGSGPGTEGDATDLFGPTPGPLFDAARLPRWWDGQPAGLQVGSLREVAEGLQFSFG